MIVGEIEKGKLTTEFIPLDHREFIIEDLDISEFHEVSEITQQLNSFEGKVNCLYEIILKGDRAFEINIYDIYKLLKNEKILKIKDETKPYVNLQELSKTNSLKGIFVSKLLEMYENETEEQKREIISKAIEIGLQVLENETR